MLKKHCIEALKSTDMSEAECAPLRVLLRSTLGHGKTVLLDVLLEASLSALLRNAGRFPPILALFRRWDRSRLEKKRTKCCCSNELDPIRRGGHWIGASLGALLLSRNLKGQTLNHEKPETRKGPKRCNVPALTPAPCRPRCRSTRIGRAPRAGARPRTTGRLPRASLAASDCALTS